MAKLTQAEIAGLADEWAALEEQITKKQTARQRALDPLLKRHGEEMDAVLVKHDPKIAKLQGEQFAIEETVLPWLADRKKDIVVAGELGAAERKTNKTFGARVINVGKFLTAAKKHAEDKMHECISVGIAKAEELLGKQAVDDISTKPPKDETLTFLRLK